MLHVPVLRAGRPYRSLDRVRLSHVQTGETVAEVSQANRGLIARDLLARGENRKTLDRLPVAELLGICKRAAKLFVESELPVDPEGGTGQSPDEFVRCQSSTTGLPETLCRANMEKTRFVLDEMERILAGLTRDLDLSALDTGWVSQNGRTCSYLAEADALGAVLPSNSPGVHSLWLPSVALKIPLVLKPGRREPWTPMRVAQALIAAGCPPQAFSFYPTDYSGSTEILLRCDRSMMFGDAATLRGWRQDHRVQLHGPGWSKVLIGEDRIDDWEQYLDSILTSVACNGGRSCINASGVWVPARGREIAEALAARLAAIEARPLDDPRAEIAAFSDLAMARRISDFIDLQLEIPGARDVTAEHRGDRVVELGGCGFVLPTVVWCDSPDHPLASTELLFPFVSVVELPQREMLDRIGSTLVATAITEDDDFKASLMSSRDVDRINLGDVPTSSVSWDQPHEGNLFEHLYRQRAFQAAGPDAPASAA
jgi:acyl-CoA reductase-like NAD-dependent aldehyde dehydrogenase